jgi:hypothetical protein
VVVGLLLPEIFPKKPDTKLKKIFPGVFEKSGIISEKPSQNFFRHTSRKTGQYYPTEAGKEYIHQSSRNLIRYSTISWWKLSTVIPGLFMAGTRGESDVFHLSHADCSFILGKIMIVTGWTARRASRLSN